MGSTRNWRSRFERRQVVGLISGEPYDHVPLDSRLQSEPDDVWAVSLEEVAQVHIVLGLSDIAV